MSNGEADGRPGATDRFEDEPRDDEEGRNGMERRKFLKLVGLSGAGVLGSAAMSGSLPRKGAAATPGGAGVSSTRPVASPALSLDPLVIENAAPPALQFHAHPGGTGALLEKLWRSAGGTPFERPPIGLDPWNGPVPAEKDLAFLPVHRLAVLVRDGHVSPVELTDLFIARLRRHDPVLTATVTYLEESARREAREAEAEIAAGRWRGPLHGIPWGLKDLFSTVGAPTTWGAEEYRERVIDEDAEIVRRLRNSGAILVAKLATGRFARGDRWFGGQTRNPWNPDQGSSGSSAGPASAVAAGLVPFAIGTETLGSIVSPARRCGVTALRPTFGRVSRHGGMVLSWSMDKVGPICRSAEDCAHVFHAIHGADPKDPSTLTAPFRYEKRGELGRVRAGYTDDAPEEVVRVLAELGAEVRAMPELPSGGSTALSVESAVAFDAHLAARGDADEGDGGPDGDRFRSGRSILALDHVQSQRERLVLMNRMAEVMEGVDFFVSGSGEVGVTNQTGHPAAVFPHEMSAGSHPQPVCTTLIGHPFGDDVLLAAVAAFQQVTDWHERRPPLG